MESIAAHREKSRESGSYPSDPIFPWFRDEVHSPVVVLAPDIPSARIPAYSAEANVVSRRGSLVLKVLPELKKRVSGRIDVPQGSLDVRDFFGRTTAADTVRRSCAATGWTKVMVEKGSPLADWLERRPCFEPVDTPSERYDLFAVDLERAARSRDASAGHGPVR